MLSNLALIKRQSSVDNFGLTAFAIHLRILRRYKIEIDWLQIEFLFNVWRILPNISLNHTTFSLMQTHLLILSLTWTRNASKWNYWARIKSRSLLSSSISLSFFLLHLSSLFLLSASLSRSLLAINLAITRPLLAFMMFRSNLTIYCTLCKPDFLCLSRASSLFSSKIASFSTSEGKTRAIGLDLTQCRTKTKNMLPCWR